MRVHYLIYQITNKSNGMIYIGKHKTTNKDDGYMGSGIRIVRAIEKYGVDNFEKTILFECSSEDEMNKLEAEIVNEDFIARDDVYNISLGGNGGWDYINKTNKNIGFKYANSHKLNNKGKKISKELREKMNEGRRLNILKNPEKYNRSKELNPMYGKTHSEETRKRLSETHTGSQNSQYGKCWIYNLDLKQSISIFKKDLQSYLNTGWIKGRKLKF